MHYKLKCFESRGETLCDSSPIPPSEGNRVNTIYCIHRIPSPPRAVCVNLLVPPAGSRSLGCNQEPAAAAPAS